MRPGEKKHNTYSKVRISILLLAAIGICLMLGAAIGRSLPGFTDQNNSIKTMDAVTLHANGITTKQQLPYKLSGLSPGEEFTVEFQLVPEQSDMLYVKTVYAPFRVYADGKLLYSYGDPASYPSFFADPPTNVTNVALPASNGKPMAIRIVYRAPNARNYMMIYAPRVGSSTAILSHLLRLLGMPLLFSVVLIFMGILLILMTFFLLNLAEGRAPFLWLGLFSLTTGVWTFSENNLTVFLLDNPSALYLLSFLGLLFVTIPLYHFAMEILSLQHNRILQVFCLFQEIAFLLAVLLQLTGLMPFSKSVLFFHVLLPFSCVFLAGYILYLGIRLENPLMKKFFLPFAVIAVSSVLETLNYQVHLIAHFSSVFELGIFIFLILAEVLAGKFVKDAIAMRQDNQLLRTSVDMLEKQSELQNERVQLLLKNDELIKEQRHDLKHQYALLSNLCEQNDLDALRDYLKELRDGVPAYQTRIYCSNTAVNAIVSHYCAEAQQDHVALSIALDLPATLSGISTPSLCVIFGNLLENAVEACRDMKKTDGEPYIHLRARVMNDSLYIAMNNSFNVVLQYQDGKLQSHKRQETGIGLLSIRSIVEKTGGYATFHADEKVFLSTIVVRLNQEA